MREHGYHCPEGDWCDEPDCDGCDLWDGKAVAKRLRERLENTDWAAMSHNLEKQLLDMDSSPEIKEAIALAKDAGDQLDAHRLGLQYEPRPASAVGEVEGDDG